MARPVIALGYRPVLDGLCTDPADGGVVRGGLLGRGFGDRRRVGEVLLRAAGRDRGRVWLGGLARFVGSPAPTAAASVAPSGTRICAPGRGRMDGRCRGSHSGNVGQSGTREGRDGGERSEMGRRRLPRRETWVPCRRYRPATVSLPNRRPSAPTRTSETPKFRVDLNQCPNQNGRDGVRDCQCPSMKLPVKRPGPRSKRLGLCSTTH